MPPRVRFPVTIPQLYCRSFRHYSSTGQPLPHNIALLPHRRLIALSGHDASHFLQGLITQNVSRKVADTAPQAYYSAFLNAAGRVLHDTILYQVHNDGGPEEASWFIEVDEQRASDLEKHLKRYKLRAKVQIRLTAQEEFQVAHAWRTESPAFPLRGYRSGGGGGREGGGDHGKLQWFRDPRTKRQGSGYGLDSSTAEEQATYALPIIEDSTTTHVTANDYHIHRYLHGIPEGPLEIPPAQALPLESNMDLLNGIDFRKGCYVGQELTIRTKHTGVVRKRILPVQLDASSTTSEAEASASVSASVPGPSFDASSSDFASRIPHGADIKAEGNGRRSIVGKWLAGVGNVGLALCRLEPMVMGDGAAERVFWVEADGEGNGDGDGGASERRRHRVRAFVPSWMDLMDGKE